MSLYGEHRHSRRTRIFPMKNGYENQACSDEGHSRSTSDEMELTPRISIINPHPHDNPSVDHGNIHIRTGVTNPEWPRFGDPQISRPHHPPNDFPGDAQSTTYSSCTHPLEGHIYEEVGPPAHSHPPPYLVHDLMDNRPDYTHQRASPASLCSDCSRHPNTFSPHSCHNTNAFINGVPSCSFHSSIPRYHPQYNFQQNGTQPMCQHHQQGQCTLPAQSCAVHSPLHHTISGVHPYHITDSPNSNSASQQNSPSGGSKKGGKRGRPLSPFSLLSKKNRDSKASTNNMLDNSSSKSLALCNRKWLLAIGISLVVILVVSIAVALVVIFGLGSSGRGHGTTTKMPNSHTALTTSKFYGKLKVIAGDNSIFNPQFRNPESDQYITYTTKFNSQVLLVFNEDSELRSLVNRVEVLDLRNGSVSVDFLIVTKEEYYGDDMKNLNSKFLKALYAASNTSSTMFARNYVILLSSIDVSPVTNPDDITTRSRAQISTTTLSTDASSPSTKASTTPSPTTGPTTTPKQTTPPQSGVCESLNNTFCSSMPWSQTTFPNIKGDRSQADAQYSINFAELIHKANTCYEYFDLFACSVLVPKCSDGNRIPPCRSFCEETLRQCEATLDRLSNDLLHNMNCTNLPESADSNVCISADRCPDGQFECDNTCKSNVMKCDKFHDCTDGKDEVNCDNFQCVEGQFFCGNGNCRPRVWKCDSMDDCGDNSDEADCDPVAPCQRGEFKCINGYDQFATPDDVCIDGSHTCDKTPDCSDGSDEFDEFCQGRNNRGGQ